MGGVSTVVAGDATLLKVHTHTPTPGKILDYGVSLGSLQDINIENLQEQSLRYAAESARERGDGAWRSTRRRRLRARMAPRRAGSGGATAARKRDRHRRGRVGRRLEQRLPDLGVSAIVSRRADDEPQHGRTTAAVEALPLRR